MVVFLNGPMLFVLIVRPSRSLCVQEGKDSQVNFNFSSNIASVVAFVETESWFLLAKIDAFWHVCTLNRADFECTPPKANDYIPPICSWKAGHTMNTGRFISSPLTKCAQTFLSRCHQRMVFDVCRCFATHGTYPMRRRWRMHMRKFSSQSELFLSTKPLLKCRTPVTLSRNKISLLLYTSPSASVRSASYQTFPWTWSYPFKAS